MMIEISVSGGFGGLAAAGPGARVATDDLPPAEAAALCEVFDPDALAGLAEASAAPGRADTLTYEIKVTDGDGSHRFDLDETQVPPETLDVIDRLLHE